MNYAEAIEITEHKIEFYLKDILNDDPYKSAKAEGYLTALCLGREYLKDKIKKESENKNEG